MNIPIIYEDDYLIVVDKPSGLLVVPTPKNETRTLTNILGRYPCHRLDRDTSGLIIYAKTREIQLMMMESFRRRLIKKNYIAFVQGRVLREKSRITSPIEGKYASTEYRVLEKKDDFSVLEVKPLTGRTNQIRIHLKRLSHPVLGDTKYAFRRDFRIKAKRLCLHARQLEFRHPVTEKQICLSVDLPNDLREFLNSH